MGARRSIGLAFLVVATACARQSGVESPVPEPIARERGPGAWIQANFWGGLVTRTVDVAFGVDQSAFVLVAHLGGDGVIRVLYPETPDFGQLVQPLRAKQTVRTTPFFAFYDGAPSLYTFRMTPFRGMGAQYASYDGAGHGFIFIIASRSPLRYDLIMDGYEWLEVPVRNYEETADPRLAIQQYALALTHGGRYTLKFATSMTSQGFVSYAAAAMDCATLSTLGLTHLQTFWSSWSTVYHSRNAFARGCGSPLYASFAFNDFFFDGIQRQRVRSHQWPNQLAPRTPIIAPEPSTPVRNRPTYRPFGERSRTVTQSALSSTPQSYAPIQRPIADRGYRADRGDRGDRGGSFTRGPSSVSGDRASPRAPVAAPAPRPSSTTPSTRTTTPSTTTTKTSSTTTKHD